MSLHTSKSLQVVIYEGPEAAPLEPGRRSALFREVLDLGFGVRKVGSSAEIPVNDRVSTLIVGDFSGKNPEELGLGEFSESARFRDLSGEDSDSDIRNVLGDKQQEEGLFDHKAWKPWFPVIDYDRCTNCMQCLSFCLFGVYGVSSEQQIQVQNQDNCKTNCPACSRVCPEAAIMFPKYKSGPINGDTVSAEDMQREKMKVDISSLLGGDVYDMLRERSERAKSRFSKERDSSKALNERQKCLVKLQKDADIPPEVIMSLPSPDEIQKRAQEASAKADAARAAIEEKEKNSKN